jgi:hypothetical protein
MKQFSNTAQNTVIPETVKIKRFAIVKPKSEESKSDVDWLKTGLLENTNITLAISSKSGFLKLSVDAQGVKFPVYIHPDMLVDLISGSKQVLSYLDENQELIAGLMTNAAAAKEAKRK